MKSMIGGDPIARYPVNSIWVEDVAYDNDIVRSSTSDTEDAQQHVPASSDGNAAASKEEGQPPLDEYHDV